MKTLNVTDQTYEELYRLVVPEIMKQSGTNLSQNDIVRELIAVYNGKTLEAKQLGKEEK